MEIGYARVSTSHQDLARQVDALEKAGIPAERVYVDKATGSNMQRPGWQAALDYARSGDTLVCYTLDRAGRSVLDVLQTVATLRERGIGLRTLADPLPIDTSGDGGPMAELALVLLSLFGQMEVTFNRERSAHAREVARANGRQVGAPTVVDPAKLAFAVHLRDEQGATMAEIVRKTGLSRATLYRHMPARPVVAPTAAGTEPEPRA